MLSGFYSAQGFLLSHVRRGQLAKKEVKAIKFIHAAHVTSLKRMRQPLNFCKKTNSLRVGLCKMDETSEVGDSGRLKPQRSFVYKTAVSLRALCAGLTAAWWLAKRRAALGNTERIHERFGGDAQLLCHSLKIWRDLSWFA